MICTICQVLILLGAMNLIHGTDNSWHTTYITNILKTGVQITANQTWADAWAENVQRANDAKPLDIEFTCGGHISKSPSMSVHTLHPADISVVASLGDFISSGRGMNVKDIFELINRQNRGEAFSSGGDGSLTTGVMTLPNILRMFTPSIVGYGSGFGGQEATNAGLNVADAFGTASTLLDQAEKLVAKMKAHPRINIDQDWKLLTIMIGHHDICRHCLDEDFYSDMEYTRHVTATIDYLRRHLPRAIISLVPVLDYSFITSLYADNPLCETLHSITCPCAAQEDQRKEMKILQKQYFNRLRKLVGEYDGTHNFTVVIQPHLVDLDITESPLPEEIQKALFGPDCFHPSRQGHQAMAMMLWNTMLTPVGQKSQSYPLGETLRLKCPTRTHPYIFTNVNSGWVQLPLGEKQPIGQEQESEEVTSEGRIEKVFLMILVGVAGSLVGIIMLGILLPIIRKKLKTASGSEAPVDLEAEKELIFKQYPRVRELMAEEGARSQSRMLRSTSSGASLVRSGSTLSFDSGSFCQARSISQTSEDSDCECKKKFYFQSSSSLESPSKNEKEGD